MPVWRWPCWRGRAAPEEDTASKSEALLLWGLDAILESGEIEILDGAGARGLRGECDHFLIRDIRTLRGWRSARRRREHAKMFRQRHVAKRGTAREDSSGVLRRWRSWTKRIAYAAGGITT